MYYSSSSLQDIFKHCTEDGITSVTEIPYFEGDFWPNIIEDTIKELDQEARDREACEAATVEVCHGCTSECGGVCVCVWRYVMAVLVSVEVCVCVCGGMSWLY